MDDSLGSFLRQLRQSKKLSQLQAAQAAGIGRVTLNRWENNVHRPRLWELEALLNILGAESGERYQINECYESSERQHALLLLKTPQATLQLEEEVEWEVWGKDVSFKPRGGDMLRALRLRRGLAQEEAARRIGVTARTLRRWENGDSWPSAPHLHSLCYILEAHDEELAALTMGRSSMGHRTRSGISIGELRMRRFNLHHHWPWYATDPPSQALRELGFFDLEAKAWPIAMQSEPGQDILSQIYASHANYYCTLERFAEAGIYAARAIACWPGTSCPNREVVQAAICLATAEVYGGTYSRPQSGLKILQQWLKFAVWPDLEAWILSDMANYLALSGQAHDGIPLAQRATAIAAKEHHHYNHSLRLLDEAQVHLKAGDPAKALLRLNLANKELYPDHIAKFQLVETEACLMMGKTAQAHETLQKATTLIDAAMLEQLRPHAQELISRL